MSTVTLELWRWCSCFSVRKRCIGSVLVEMEVLDSRGMERGGQNVEYSVSEVDRVSCRKLKIFFFEVWTSRHPSPWSWVRPQLDLAFTPHIYGGILSRHKFQWHRHRCRENKIEYNLRPLNTVNTSIVLPIPTIRHLLMKKSSEVQVDFFLFSGSHLGFTR